MIRAYAQEEAQIHAFDEPNREYVARNVKLIRTWSMFMPSLQALIGTTFLIVLWKGGFFFLRGQLSLGGLVSFSNFLTLLVPIWLPAGQLGAGLLGPAGVLSGGRDRGLRTITEAAETRGQPGRHLEIEIAQELVSVVATELQPEVGEVASDRVRDPATRLGLNGRCWPGHGLPLGPSSIEMIGLETCGEAPHSRA